MRHSAIDSKRHRLTPLRDRAIRRDGFDLKAEDHIHHQTLLFPLQRHPPTGMKTISIISFPQIEHHHSNLVFLHNTIRLSSLGYRGLSNTRLFPNSSREELPLISKSIKHTHNRSNICNRARALPFQALM